MPWHGHGMRPAIKPGLLVVWRDRDTLQIGIDPRRAVALTGMARAAGLIGLLDGSREHSQVLAAAEELGIPRDAADQVIGLLAAAGAVQDFPAAELRALPDGPRARLARELATVSLAHGHTDGGARALARRQAATVLVYGVGPVGTEIASLLTASGVGRVVGTGPVGQRPARPTVPSRPRTRRRGTPPADASQPPAHGDTTPTATGQPPAQAGQGPAGGSQPAPPPAGGRMAQQRPTGKSPAHAVPGPAGQRTAQERPAGQLPAERQPTRQRAAEAGAGPRSRRISRRRADPRPRPDLAVLADGYPAELPAQLVASGVLHLAASAREAIGVVGPLVVPGQSACLGCVELARSDRDPAWPFILAQAAGQAAQPVACAATLATAVAAQAVSQVLSCLDLAQPAVAVTNATLELVAPGWQWRRRSWPRHGQCRCSTQLAT
jgi:hypothetical protein